MHAFSIMIKNKIIYFLITFCLTRKVKNYKNRNPLHNAQSLSKFYSEYAESLPVFKKLNTYIKNEPNRNKTSREFFRQNEANNLELASPVKPITSPFLRAINLALQKITPVIASLQIPDIAPVLGIITNGFTSIIAQITGLFENGLERVGKLIQEYTSVLTPEIVNVLTEGNNRIGKTIIGEFYVARNNFTNDVIAITDRQNQENKDLVYSQATVLNEQIVTRLNQVERLIDEAVNLGLVESIANVLSAIRNANEAVYVKIITLLADEENTDAILPLLVFADPKAIAELISSDSGSLYLSVESVLRSALLDIQSYVAATSDVTSDSEASMLNAANNDIVKSLNSHIDAALRIIRVNIDEVTENEVASIKKLLDGSFGGLPKEIISIVANIAPESVNIVNNESNNMVTSLNDLVTKNNANVVSQVVKRLTEA